MFTGLSLVSFLTCVGIDKDPRLFLHCDNSTNSGHFSNCTKDNVQKKYFELRSRSRPF